MAELLEIRELLLGLPLSPLSEFLFNREMGSVGKFLKATGSHDFLGS